MLTFILFLVLLAASAYVQNAAFTWVSRSRNSADVGYHRKAAICSNGIWFVTQLLIIGQVWPALTEGEWWKIAVTGLVYIAATTEGSCMMMAKLLKKETGARRVGAQTGTK